MNMMTPTKRTGLALGLGLTLLLPQAGQCFYNPSTGRWLKRDPIGEAGGPNLLAFALNRPTLLVDPLGLQFNCPFCLCIQNTVSYDPKPPPGVGWYFPPTGTGNSKVSFGNYIHVTWAVVGIPQLCTYGQKESGHVRTTRPNGAVSEATIQDNPNVSQGVSVTYGAGSASYYDPMGFHFLATDPNGTYRFDADLHIDFYCTDSFGTKVSGQHADFQYNGPVTWGGYPE
jgi:hypothetical protein